MFLRNFTPCPCKLWERSLTHDTTEFSPKGRGRGHAPKNLRPECVDQSLLELTPHRRREKDTRLTQANKHQQEPTIACQRQTCLQSNTKHTTSQCQHSPTKKTLKIGNGDETCASPIFLSNPSSSSTTSSPFETPPPTQTSITARELTVFPAVLRVKSLPVDDHLSSSSVLPSMAMMMNIVMVMTRPHRSLLLCRRISHCREVLPRFVV